MKKIEFENWLIERHSIQNPQQHVYIISKIEEYYGDVDMHYLKDKCASLLSEFEYTTDDKRNKKKPKHKIPINSTTRNTYDSYYALTGDYRNILKRKYMEFLKEVYSNRKEGCS